MDPLKDLFFFKYRLNLMAKDPIILPRFNTSVIRGTFGLVLRRIVCPFRNNSCEECLIQQGCAYRIIMESPFSNLPEYKRKYKNAPHPYIIIPPFIEHRIIEPSQPFSVELVLIGEVEEKLPYFVLTFIEMGRMGLGKTRGKFIVNSVDALSSDGTETEIYNSKTEELRAFRERIDYSCFSADFGNLKSDENLQITVSFETPARIKVNNKLTSDIPFKVFIERLSERALLLAHLYCGAELGNVTELIEGSERVKTVSSNLKWIDLTRYSSRQKTVMKLGGVLGDITYAGPLKRYIPLLKVGEHIHLGKSTTFGLGKYKIALKTEEGNPNGRDKSIREVM